MSGDDLLRVNRDLDAQLRELVRTQQRVYLSERENARQLARLENLTAFAIAVTELTDPDAVLARGASLVFDHFPFEQYVGFLSGPDGRLVATAVGAVEGLVGDSVARLERARTTRLANIPQTEPVFDRSTALVARCPELRPALERLSALFDTAEPGAHANDAPVLALPLARSGGEPVGLLLFRRVSRKLSFHEELPTPSGMSFLALVARHVAAALANARLVRGLEARHAELERAQAALVGRERLAALGELAAQVAHEVRNPLGAIFNALALLRPLLAKEPSDENGAQVLAVLEEESARINAIVSELLEFARPMSPALHREPLMPIIGAAIETLHATLPETVVRVVAAPDLPMARLDARLLRQALVNLLINAAQATEGDAPIDVRVRGEEGTLRVDVVNSGPAIPCATLERIFEPFFTTKATGTGLGLSVVKRAVHAHGGDVSVTSADGGSTVFSIMLPLG